MKDLRRNISGVYRLFILLFFVANSGFTVVLYHCTMDGMPDCINSDKGVPVNCGAGEHQQASGALVTSASMPCHVIKVAGGFHTDPSVVERESGTKHIKVEQIQAPVSLCVSIPLVHHETYLFNCNRSNTSLHPVEAYVLNSTFLI